MSAETAVVAAGFPALVLAAWLIVRQNRQDRERSRRRAAEERAAYLERAKEYAKSTRVYCSHCGGYAESTANPCLWCGCRTWLTAAEYWTPGVVH